jgi:Caspase domain
MKHQRRFVLALLSMLLFGSLASAGAEAAETRVALVVGNANYSSGALPTPANDAGLIAQTLQAAGFDVVGVRDLDQDSLRRTFRDFIAKVSAAGPDTVAFVYLSGYGLQLEGENYFAPTDANIARDANVSSEALRLSDYTKPLAALGIKASIVVLDGARANPFAKSGPPLAGGLALVEPDPGTLIAFNAAPGTVAQNEAGPYSSYAQALAEMMREGGLPVTEVFNRVRLRVNDITKGAQVPWNASKLPAPFYFFERAPDAPPRFRPNRRHRSDRSRSVISTRGRPISRLSIATICRITRTSWSPIPGIRWRDGCEPSLRPAARPSRGGAAAASIRPPPTGRICVVTPTVSMPTTHGAGLPIWRPRSSRRRDSKSSATMCRRRRRKKSFTSNGRY